MTGRERLERMIDNLPTDRVPLATLVDNITRSQMAPEWRDIPILEFYRKLGYDHLQFGNYGLPQELHFIPPIPSAQTTSPKPKNGAMLPSTAASWTENPWRST